MAEAASLNAADDLFGSVLAYLHGLRQVEDGTKIVEQRRDLNLQLCELPDSLA